jgi:hypothetical protein
MRKPGPYGWWHKSKAIHHIGAPATEVAGSACRARRKPERVDRARHPGLDREQACLGARSADLEIINHHARRLNREAADVLDSEQKMLALRAAPLATFEID